MTRRALLAWLVVLLAACAAGPGTLPPGAPPDHRLYVTSNDWHTRIVVASRDIPDGLLPEAAALPPTGWLAFGWGDHRYYPMPEPPARVALEAALLPGPAVLHLVPMAGRPRVGDELEVLEIAVSAAGLEAMLASIDATLDRDGRPRAPVAAPGLYPASLFFPATGRFHLFSTCNTWVARQLIAAGLPVRAWGVITAEDLMRQLRGLPMAQPALG